VYPKANFHPPISHRGVEVKGKGKGKNTQKTFKLKIPLVCRYAHIVYPTIARKCLGG